MKRFSAEQLNMVRLGLDKIPMVIRQEVLKLLFNVWLSGVVDIPDSNRTSRVVDYIP